MSVGHMLPLLQRPGAKGAEKAAQSVGYAVEAARNYGRLLVELSKDKKRFSKVQVHRASLCRSVESSCIAS
jgi:hypothetical protein